MPKTKAPAPSIAVRVRKKQSRFARIRQRGPDAGTGEFFFLVDVTAPKEAVYLPLSIASGKKPTGFVYQIEGTTEGAIVTASVSPEGRGVTQVTFGTLLYAKIPAGKTASFRILITMRGKAGSEYGITIVRMHYKRDPGDARYEKYEEAIAGKPLKFA